MRTFSSPLAALSWWHRERQRADGLRAQGYEPRTGGPVGKPLTKTEDRLLLLAVIGCAVRRIPGRYRRVLLLSVAEDLGPMEVAAQLGCSRQWVWRLQKEGRAEIERRLRRCGVIR